MTDRNQNEKREGAPFESIKILNDYLNAGGEITKIMADIKALRRKVDTIISEREQKLNESAELAAQRKEAARPAPPPPPEKKSIRPEEAISPQPSKPQPSYVKGHGSAYGIPDERERGKRDNNRDNNRENSRDNRDGRDSRDGNRDNNDEKAGFNRPARPQTPYVAPAEQKDFEATSQKVMPSYIRGVATPTPARPPMQKPPRSYEHGGQGGGNWRERQGTGYNNNFGNRMGGGRPPFQQGQGFNNQGGRPPFGTKPKPLPSRPAMAAPVLNKDRKVDNKKKEYSKPDEKKSLNKRTLIRKGFITENYDEQRMGSRKLKIKRARENDIFVAKRIEKAIITTENLTVKILSEKIGKTAQEIIKQLMVLGIMTSINSVVDFPTMELVANEMGVELELKLAQTKESMLEDIHDVADDETKLAKRPPIITVMGHVDHGKTSLLDAIRKTSVATGEAGGITQHIGAYSTMCKGEKITFLDTPGHEAFTALRARGAQVTDIAILIVAADDGVMPQTVEAINHAKAAGVPILVAINKIDKPGADIERIKQELTAFELVPEEWGGDTIMVPISAKRGDGIDKLLEMVLLLAEMNNYRANPDRTARGLIIEAKVDKGKGPIANVIIQNGTLRVGDFVVSGISCGRVRAMVDDKGRNIKEAAPSSPVSILGFTSVPGAGDGIYVVEDEKMAKQIIEERNVKFRNEQINLGPKASLEDLMVKINEGMLKELNIVIKADVQGSMEALKNSLSKITSDEVRLNIVHSGIGAINKSDIMLAEVSNALVVGFNVRPDSESKSLAESSGIDIRLYSVIYEAIDDVEKAVKGMLAPKLREVMLGKAQVRNVFKITNAGMIAGSYVLDGKIVRGSNARIKRNGELIHEGVINGLKRFKDDAKEVATGYECGISVSNFTDIKELDEIECFTVIEEVR